MIGALLALFWNSDTECEEYFIILYIRCIYWMFTFVRIFDKFHSLSFSIFAFLNNCLPILIPSLFYCKQMQLYDHVIKFHHEKLRMNGYHEFYRATSLHKGVPLNTVSLWNTVILGIQTIMQHQYGPEFFDHCVRRSLFSPTSYIVMFR